MNRKVLQVIIVAVLLVVVGGGIYMFANKDKDVAEPTPNKSTTPITTNEKVEQIVKEVDSAKEEISKNNKLTEDEMLKIGKEVETKAIENYYKLKNDNDLKKYVSDIYLDEETQFNNLKDAYQDENAKYSKGEVSFTNESVEPYGTTGFVYRANIKEVGYIKNSDKTDSATSTITINLDKDSDGQYKIAAISVNNYVEQQN